MHPDDRPQQLAEGFFLESDRTQHISRGDCTLNQADSIPLIPLVVTLEELIMSKGQ
ncbi:hypothetical protein Mic7113_0342 [Allocoleopsis franciscana PCC 7113]|uniref:Uncharacterized protein n=1 Tax=Allocoleopsis franciscana PCC 7113 TaxID=1173027 RepID=K9W8Y3_9CYAN|nr:hypothetical protein Mic7113_0342 [Allocoleopsis franciscana PCC 7113]